ncbi:MAG: HAMP domain-containing histidine kinase [Planctomycetes bacterium]|nr:HAMP domain-containing histidine kinase [Planctomycetota bacterium]
MTDAVNNSPPSVYRLVQPASGGSVSRGNDDVHDRAGEEQLLRQQAAWFCRLRWLVVAVLTLAGCVGLLAGSSTLAGIQVPRDWPWAAATILAVANLLFGAALTRGRAFGSIRQLRLLLWLQIGLDLLVLTAVVHCVGSVETYAPFAYLFHIILACVFFRPAPSLLVVTLSAVLYLACLVLESSGAIEPTTILGGPGVVNRASLTVGPLIVQVASAFAIWTIIWCLTSRQASILRRRERDLVLSHARLTASIDERSRHMLQTTHQLKAPFAAIHALAQLMLRAHASTMPDKAVALVRAIEARCNGLSRQIQDMVQLANLRSASQTPPAAAPLDLADIVRSVVAGSEPAASQRGISIAASLEPAVVNAVEDHMRMIVDNLVTNAVNYSFEGGTVDVTLGNGGGDPAARLIVRDRGIGIPADKIARIFDDYFRTTEATKHNQHSTGLGLAIVRHVAQAAGIDVEVRSAPGWGTCFTLTIPR